MGGACSFPSFLRCPNQRAAVRVQLHRPAPEAKLRVTTRDRTSDVRPIGSRRRGTDPRLRIPPDRRSQERATSTHLFFCSLLIPFSLSSWGRGGGASGMVGGGGGGSRDVGPAFELNLIVARD